MNSPPPHLVRREGLDLAPFNVLPESLWRATLNITNYNGLDNLEAYLPLNLIAVSQSPYCDEVVVVDDGSVDGSAEFIRRNFPKVKLVCIERNRGFGNAANRGLEAAKNDYVVNISNDMVITPQFFRVLFESMAFEDVFCVTSRLVGVDGRLQRGRTVPFFMGDFKMWKVLSREPPVDLRNRDRLYAHFCGAIGLFNKRIFQEIGGFDDLYLPFYVEENDLCYRAWKRGYRVLYEPRAWVMHYHEESGTILHNFSWEKRKIQYKKNRFIFLWKNLTSPHYIVLHLVWLTASFCFSWVTGNIIFYKAFKLALERWDEIMEARREEVPYFVRSDQDVHDLMSRDFYLPESGLHGSFPMIEAGSRKA